MPIFGEFIYNYNMPKKQIAFVVNPISGGMNKGAIADAIHSTLDVRTIEYKIVYTERAGHAYDLAKSFVQHNANAVVAVGGDGTVNEVARALVHTHTALAIIPCGSGNGLARHLRIPLNPQNALKIVSRFQTELLDYGRINDTPFFCTCGIGFDAFVSAKFAQSEKRGPLAYLENTLREGLTYKPDTYTLTTDVDTTTHKAFLIACANASQYGNNARIAPHASMSDGLMDVTIIEPFNALEAPQIALQLFNGTLPQNNKIHTFRCKQITITRAQPGLIHADGEPLTTGTQIHVQLIQHALNTIINTHPQENIIEQNASQLYRQLITLRNNLRERNQEAFDKMKTEIIRKLQK